MPGNALILTRPRFTPGRSVIVSIPHYGTAALPGTDPDDYADASFAHFPLSYADTLAAELYGGLHRFGATVIACPVSRLFVDVNRARDDFRCEGDRVISTRGVIRTHLVDDRPIFARGLSMRAAEERLCAHYDPYHRALRALVDEGQGRGPAVVLLDAHTGSPKGMGEHEIIIGTRRGRTAAAELADRIAHAFATQGFAVSRDVSGYAGGHVVGRYGRPAAHVHAVQIEVNAGLLTSNTRDERVERARRGLAPAVNAANLERLGRALAEIVETAARLEL